MTDTDKKLTKAQLRVLNAILQGEADPMSMSSFSAQHPPSTIKALEKRKLITRGVGYTSSLNYRDQKGNLGVPLSLTKDGIDALIKATGQ